MMRAEARENERSVGSRKEVEWLAILEAYTDGRTGLRETAVRCGVGEVDLIWVLLRMGSSVDEDVARRAVRRCREQIEEVEALLDDACRAVGASVGHDSSALHAYALAG